MRIVLTLLVRDEEDVLEPMLRYHYARGVDFVIATDHLSTDRTPEILASFEREGRLRALRETGATVRQAEWVTRMARLAATDHDAEWVINSDADEFWWPRLGSFAETLAAIPPRFGVVRGLWRHFVPRPAPPADFAERMTVRTVPSVDLADPYHGQVKAVHRADPAVVITQGNHDAHLARGALIREWFPFEVLHFPLRSPEQVRRKFGRLGEAHRWEAGTAQHAAAAGRSLDRGGPDAYFAARVVDDAALARGLAACQLVDDTRLRDALRAVTAGVESLPPWCPDPRDEVDFAAEAHVALAHDARLGLQRRATRLQHRLERVERSALVRLARRGR